ncbi:hypothetical protein [Parasphingorhabdus pacifica]
MTFSVSFPAARSAGALVARNRSSPALSALKSKAPGPEGTQPHQVDVDQFDSDLAADQVGGVSRAGRGW